MHFDYAQYKQSLRSFQDLKQKGFSVVLILIGVVILGLVISGAYLLGRQTTQKPQPQNQVVISTPQPFPTPDETANWKTYKDTVGGFEIIYPQDMKLGKNPIEDQEIVNIYFSHDYIEGEDNKKVVFLNIKVFPNTEHLTNNDLITQINALKGIGPESHNKEKGSLKPYKNGVIDGIYFMSGFDYDHDNIRMATKERVYYFSYTGDQGTKVSQESEVLITKILSTFKFLR